jgi:hypothetical protein
MDSMPGGSFFSFFFMEYDFDIVHRPGVKHNNADTLSRFPQKTTADFTGARFDVEEVLKVEAG